MTVFKLHQDFFDKLNLVANPTRTYTSSSAGTIGSVYLFAERSDSIKDTTKTNTFEDRLYDDVSVDTERQDILDNISKDSLTNFYGKMEEYLAFVHKSGSISLRQKQAVDIIRFSPSVRFTR